MLWCNSEGLICCTQYQVWCKPGDRYSLHSNAWHAESFHDFSKNVMHVFNELIYQETRPFSTVPTFSNIFCISLLLSAGKLSFFIHKSLWNVVLQLITLIFMDISIYFWILERVDFHKFYIPFFTAGGWSSLMPTGKAQVPVAAICD